MSEPISVSCIKCGKEGDMCVDLNNPKELHCLDCDERYDISEVDDHVSDWLNMLFWIKRHPNYPRESSDGEAANPPSV